jgi:hypothetical protein
MLKQWFAKSGEAPAELKHALADLAKLTQPALATAVDVLREVLVELFGEVGPTCRVGPEAPLGRIENDTSEAARSRPAGGTYLDPKALRKRWLAICKIVARQNPNAQAVAKAFDDLTPSALLTNIRAGQPEVVHAKAEELHLDPALTATVLRFTALPTLVAEIQAREPSAWEHGHCPNCHSWPLLGEFRGLEQTRFLRCGWCATGWEFPRLRCPFCGNHDHRTIGFFHVEGEENRYRAATCDECHGYVKMVSTLSALSPPQLLVADLATLHLDLAAAEKGYWV